MMEHLYCSSIQKQLQWSWYVLDLVFPQKHSRALIKTTTHFDCLQHISLVVHTVEMTPFENDLSRHTESQEFLGFAPLVLL